MSHDLISNLHRFLSSAPPLGDCCKITEAEVNLIFYNISLRYKSWIEASWANIDPVSLHSPDYKVLAPILTFSNVTFA